MFQKSPGRNENGIMSNPAATESEEALPLSARVVVVLFLLAVSFLGILDHDLWTPDEPRVACIANTMQKNGEWVVPTLAGEIFIEKPPLYFVVCGWCGKLFAPVLRCADPQQAFVGAARLSVAFCALGTLFAAFWLGCSLGGGRLYGWLAAMVLGTMPLFADQMHSMRVDVLLACCVGLAVAALASAYRNDHPWCLLWAALAAAGAFLSKGPIALVFIGIAWIPLFCIFIQKRRNASAGEEFRQGRGGEGSWWVAHLCAIALFLLLCGSWVFALWNHPNPDAWKQWFWDNQVGRFQGTVPSLGHQEPYAVWYYPVALVSVMGLWIPVFAYWLWWRGRWLKEHRQDWPRICSSGLGVICIWGFSGMLALTCAATKRGLYLLPLHAAYALMCSDACRHFLRNPVPAWLRWCCNATGMIVLVGYAGICLLPLAGLFIRFPDTALWQVLGHFGGYHVLTLAFGACGFVLWRKWAGVFALRQFLVSALLLILYFCVPMQAIDTHKSMREQFRAVCSILPENEGGWSRTAAWNFDETVRAGLEFYDGIVLEPLPSDALQSGELRRVLEGGDARYDAILVQLRKHDLPEEFNPWIANAPGVDITSKRRLRYLTVGKLE